MDDRRILWLEEYRLEQTVCSLAEMSPRSDFALFVLGRHGRANQIKAFTKSLAATHFGRILLAELSATSPDNYVKLQALSRLLDDHRLFLNRGGGAPLEPEPGAAPAAGSSADPEAAESGPSAIEARATVPTAPRIGEALIGLFCDPALKEAILGDLAERFDERAASSGPKAARAWYWGQVVRSFVPFAWRWVRRLIELEEIFRRIGP